MENDENLEDCFDFSSEDSDSFQEWIDGENPSFFLENFCGYIKGYGCTLAGSEECDWECPRNS